jgi:hypothetical protein
LVKISVSLTTELKELLEQYARAHSEAWGRETDFATLIPFMLQTFMERDREFARRRGLKVNS